MMRVLLDLSFRLFLLVYLRVNRMEFFGIISPIKFAAGHLGYFLQFVLVKVLVHGVVGFAAPRVRDVLPGARIKARGAASAVFADADGVDLDTQCLGPFRGRLPPDFSGVLPAIRTQD